MKRIHLIILLLVVYQLPAMGQVTNLPGTSIWFELPGPAWKLTINQSNGGKTVYVYQRDPVKSDPGKPAISFLREKLDRQYRIIDYYKEKMQIANIKELHYFDYTEAKEFGLVNGMLAKGFGNGDTVYFAGVVNGTSGMIIMCSAHGSNSFQNYDFEFRSFLRSLGYNKAKQQSNSSARTNDAKLTNATVNDQTKEEAVKEKEKINLCSYFPTVAGMKYEYSRNDQLGNHAVVEQYTPAKDRIISNGKNIKGFRIRTTIPDRDRTVIYYYCDNGSMKMLSEMPNYNTQVTGYVEDYSIFPSDFNKPEHLKTPIWETEKSGSGKFLNFTELKSGNVGTKWTDVQIVNDNPVIITSEIAEVGLSITVRGKAYSSVIKVNRSVVIKSGDETIPLNTQEIYYADGVGKIKVIERGTAILGGEYTTTQELVSYSIPGQ